MKATFIKGRLLRTNTFELDIGIVIKAFQQEEIYKYIWVSEGNLNPACKY